MVNAKSLKILNTTPAAKLCLHHLMPVITAKVHHSRQYTESLFSIINSISNSCSPQLSISIYRSPTKREMNFSSSFPLYIEGCVLPPKRDEWITDL